MKHRFLWLVLPALAVLAAAASLTGLIGTEGAWNLLAFPYVQLGALLRALSLSGAAGNVAAWALYLLLCLLPVAYLLLRAWKRRAGWADAMLVLLSAVLFFAMELFINPAEIAARFDGAIATAYGGMALGGTIDSILLAYLVLRLLRACGSGTETLIRGLRSLLYAVAVVLVLAVFGTGLSGLLAAFTALREANTALPASALTVSYGFLGLQFLVDALPALLGLPVVLAALDLVNAFAGAPYGDGMVAAAHALGRRSRIAVIAVLLGQVALNLLQLLLGSAVRQSSYTLNVPLGGVALLLGALLLSELIARGRRLQDDNDSII